MTVKELKEYLSKFPDDLRVMERGYEGGYNDIIGGERKKIALDVNNEWYYGSHDNAEDGRDLKDAVVIDALIL